MKSKYYIYVLIIFGKYHKSYGSNCIIEKMMEMMGFYKFRNIF